MRFHGSGGPNFTGNLINVAEKVISSGGGCLMTILNCLVIFAAFVWAFQKTVLGFAKTFL